MNFFKCQSSLTPLLNGLLLCLLMFAFLVQGMAHVGQKCFLSNFCRGKNTYCDNDSICRCLPDFPVLVSPHNCRKPRKYGAKCEFPEECSYHDKNSYCTQWPYRSICECLNDYIYNKEKEICVKVMSTREDRQSLVLPTILGISLAAACIMCCCLALWQFCLSRQSREDNRFLRRFRRNRQENTTNENERDVPSRYDDALPPYEMIIRENQMHSSVDELPPSYNEVMKQVEMEIKPK
ncbi:uncharacterized protein LOC111637185 [Centruroides sculpturatus]|uniref:uncharacterized protein LOC111637185 n=1 Tax=Centruroides sculpturatus TaxID=218467 RepID=UPI000C6CB86E|nr:uncharacterized protein LOC111637185 [Centruroides sculpturatus]